VIDWRPSANIEHLRRRAQVLRTLREFFFQRQVLEVETPVLAAAAVTDPNIESLCVGYDGPGAPASRTLWLQTSPEYAMKRLLAAGSGSIYQICHAFRAGERGRRHNPEFTLLEWYRVGFDHHLLMEEVAELVRAVLGERPVERLGYREAFLKHAGVNPWQTTVRELKACAESHGIPLPPLAEDALDGWLDLLLSEVVSPRLGGGRYTFVYDFPPTQAALARIRREGDESFGERFELFIDGLEIANGYHELTDPREQAERFQAERQRRQAAGQPVSVLDERLLAALAAGLPECAGVALGLDRLVMLAVGTGSIEEVLTFPVERA
jgi:lysyl-tRNA synthetase class 2